MKILVVYDSVSKVQMTKQVAEIVAGTLKERGNEVKLANINDARGIEMDSFDALIVGSPTMAWKPTPATMDYLDILKGKKVAGKPAAAFDTQMKSIASGNGTKAFEKKLGELGFKVEQPGLLAYVEGPRDAYRFKEGETERIKAWAGQIVTGFK